MGKSLKNAKIRQFREDPHCRYCGRETILEHPKGPSPENLATIDHVYSRLQMDQRKKRHYGKETRRILVCFQCNQYKNDLEVAAIPIEELWERSGRKKNIKNEKHEISIPKT